LTWGFAALHPRLYAVARCRGLGLVGPLPELEEKLHGELHVAAFKIAASEDATLRRYEARRWVAVSIREAANVQRAGYDEQVRVVEDVKGFKAKNSAGGLKSRSSKGATIVPVGPHAQKANSSLASANSQPGAEINLQNLDSRRDADCSYWI
jgi:hypothetical protein